MTKPLEQFWMDEAKRELDILLPKAREYGSSDLRIMGYALRDWLGLDKFSAHDGEEMAIAFYALGKVARLLSAYQDGRLPSRDTWEDLAIYARMAIRVREAHGWPGPLGEKNAPAPTPAKTNGHAAGEGAPSQPPAPKPASKKPAPKQSGSKVAAVKTAPAKQPTATVVAKPPATATEAVAATGTENHHAAPAAVFSPGPAAAARWAAVDNPSATSPTTATPH